MWHNGSVVTTSQVSQPSGFEPRLEVLLLILAPGLNYQETVTYSNVAQWLWMQSDMMDQWLSRLTKGIPWRFERH